MITITQLRGRHWIKRGDMLHVTHYPSSGAAAQAARTRSPLTLSR